MAKSKREERLRRKERIALEEQNRRVDEDARKERIALEAHNRRVDEDARKERAAILENENQELLATVQKQRARIEELEKTLATMNEKAEEMIV
jgi:hypothetical protein